MGFLSLKFPMFLYTAIFVSVLISTSMQKVPTSTTQKAPNTPAQEFDYIVVGGGTAGLAVAARLSEDPKVTVLVLEAGGSDLNNTGISIPGFSGTTIRSSIDWNYTTVAQESAGKRAMIYPRGKVLGGSSAMNFILATKPSRPDYDTVESLGNPGWGWTEFDRASKKSEKLLLPKAASAFSFVKQDHGTEGPLKTSFPKFLPPTFAKYFPAAKVAGHQPPPTDTFGGSLKGPYYFASTINEKAERVTSATAYYYPFASRTNLVVRLNCEVDRLTTLNSTAANIVIKGVQYSSQGSPQQVLAKKEVILSAGSFGTPAILERSGMGDPAILKPLYIPVVLPLPGVGANLIDHPWVWSTYQLLPGVISADNITTNATFAAEQMKLYTENREGLLTHGSSLLDFEPMSSFLTEQEVSEGMGMLKPLKLAQNVFTAIKKQLTSGTSVEFLVANRGMTTTPTTKGSFITIGIALEYPLSRGTSHIASADPTKAPLIDPGFFRNPFDLWLLAKAAQHSRKIMGAPSWKSVILGEDTPGPKVKTDEDWSKYVEDNASTIYHAIGTAAMLPKARGGVVDTDLRVYGTQNLRVIDACVLPIHLAMHPQMTVYAIAELGAEKILKSQTPKTSTTRQLRTTYPSVPPFWF